MIGMRAEVQSDFVETLDVNQRGVLRHALV